MCLSVKKSFNDDGEQKLSRNRHFSILKNTYWTEKIQVGSVSRVEKMQCELSTKKIWEMISAMS